MSSNVDFSLILLVYHCMRVCMCVVACSGFPLCVFFPCVQTVSAIWIPVRYVCVITPQLLPVERRGVWLWELWASLTETLLLVFNTAPTWVTANELVFIHERWGSLCRCNTSNWVISVSSAWTRRHNEVWCSLSSLAALIAKIMCLCAWVSAEVDRLRGRDVKN